jgi:hypothetical protein
MDFRIKLLELAEAGTYLIVIAQGIIEAEGFERLLRKVAEASEPLFDCRVLIDLEEAALRFECREILGLAHTVGDFARPNLKIALVSFPESERLRALAESLRRRGINSAVFDCPKSAVAWLSERK